MSKKLAKVLILSLICMFGLVTSAFSVPSLPYYLSYTTDPVNNLDDQSPFADILFELRVTDIVGEHLYHAEFTITPPSSPPAEEPNWYIGWFVLQFDASTPAVILDSPVPPDPNPGGGTWGVLAPDTALVWGGQGNGWITPANAGKSGLYLTNLLGPPGLPWEGVSLNDGGSYTFVFNFLETSTLAETVNFQVGFYSDIWHAQGKKSEGDGFYQHTQLSSTLVPEPSTLVLLGSGLIAIGLLGRRKFKERS